LTRDEYEALIAGVCTYCGAVLPPTGHAIDRIDPSRGYTPDNVVPANRKCAQESSQRLLPRVLGDGDGCGDSGHA
jgi:hypothetical protein